MPQIFGFCLKYLGLLRLNLDPCHRMSLQDTLLCFKWSQVSIEYTSMSSKYDHQYSTGKCARARSNIRLYTLPAFDSVSIHQTSCNPSSGDQVSCKNNTHLCPGGHLSLSQHPILQHLTRPPTALALTSMGTCPVFNISLILVISLLSYPYVLCRPAISCAGAQGPCYKSSGSLAGGPEQP